MSRLGSGVTRLPAAPGPSQPPFQSHPDHPPSYPAPTPTTARGAAAPTRPPAVLLQPLGPGLPSRPVPLVTSHLTPRSSPRTPRPHSCKRTARAPGRPIARPRAPAGDPPTGAPAAAQALHPAALGSLQSPQAGPFPGLRPQLSAQVPPAPRSACSLGPLQPQADVAAASASSAQSPSAISERLSSSRVHIAWPPGLHTASPLLSWPMMAPHPETRSVPRLQPSVPTPPPQAITPRASQPRSRPSAVLTQRGRRRRTASSSLCGRPRPAAPSPPLPSRSCP